MTNPLALFRIVQEALTSEARHAQATRVEKGATVRVRMPSGARLANDGDCL